MAYSRGAIIVANLSSVGSLLPIPLYFSSKSCCLKKIATELVGVRSRAGAGNSSRAWKRGQVSPSKYQRQPTCQWYVEEVKRKKQSLASLCTRCPVYGTFERVAGCASFHSHGPFMCCLARQLPHCMLLSVSNLGCRYS